MQPFTRRELFTASAAVLYFSEELSAAPAPPIEEWLKAHRAELLEVIRVVVRNDPIIMKSLLESIENTPGMADQIDALTIFLRRWVSRKV